MSECWYYREKVTGVAGISARLQIKNGGAPRDAKLHSLEVEKSAFAAAGFHGR